GPPHFGSPGLPPRMRLPISSPGRLAFMPAHSWYEGIDHDLGLSCWPSAGHDQPGGHGPAVAQRAPRRARRPGADRTVARGAAARELTGRWREVARGRGGRTGVGSTSRPRQCEDLNLDPRHTLAALLSYPFEVVRLSAYWDRVEPSPGKFDPSELDWQLDAA